MRDRWRNENDAAGQVDEEDPSWADEFHDADACEASDGEGSLGAGEEARGGWVGGAFSCLRDVVNEIACDSDLGACVTEPISLLFN